MRVRCVRIGNGDAGCDDDWLGREALSLVRWAVRRGGGPPNRVRGVNIVAFFHFMRSFHDALGTEIATMGKK